MSEVVQPAARVGISNVVLVSCDYQEDSETPRRVEWEGTRRKTVGQILGSGLKNEKDNNHHGF